MLKQLSILITGHDLKKYSPGLGANSSGYWRMLLPYSRLFFDPSMTHDLNYTKGGDADDRRIADDIFYEDCMYVSETKLQKWFAELYYECVKEFGYFYFNYHI